MSFFPSMQKPEGVLNILRFNPLAGQALIALHTAALRNESSLSPADKELIAAFVSGLNECRYCYGVHSRTAIAYGLDESTLQSLIDDVDGSSIRAELKPLLRYVQKLTVDPSRMTQSDARAVFDAGWDEQALHEAVLTTCIFNFMNRLLEGHGVKGGDIDFAERGRALHDQGYEPLLAALRAGR